MTVDSTVFILQAILQCYIAGKYTSCGASSILWRWIPMGHGSWSLSLHQGSVAMRMETRDVPVEIGAKLIELWTPVSISLFLRSTCGAFLRSKMCGREWWSFVHGILNDGTVFLKCFFSCFFFSDSLLNQWLQFQLVDYDEWYLWNGYSVVCRLSKTSWLRATQNEMWVVFEKCSVI